MTKLRLVADDLTGALDAGAQFAGPGSAVAVYLRHRLPEILPERCAVDAASRDAEGGAAAAIAAATAHLLTPAPGTLIFKKVDSLLRGNTGAELAALLRSRPAWRCVIAPAFPFHGRVTRGGRQHVLRDGSWQLTGEDLRAVLAALGMAVGVRHAGDPVPEGISLWDCETDDDLRRIAGQGAALQEPVLWCGSGGLAAALAGSAPPVVPASRLGRPLLGLFGSDHPVTAAQLRGCAADVLGLGDFGEASGLRVAARLAACGVCHIRMDLPSGIGRAEASRRIAAGMGELIRRMAPPASVLVAGGETLRALCVALGTDHLEVNGQVMPGVPVSRMCGGLWDGVEVVSKSGAFGAATLIQEIAGRGTSS